MGGAGAKHVRTGHGKRRAGGAGGVGPGTWRASPRHESACLASAGVTMTTPSFSDPGAAGEAPEMVCRYTRDTTLTFVNDAYCRAFGRSREELLGTSFLSLVPEALHAALREQIERVAQHPEGLPYE